MATPVVGGIYIVRDGALTLPPNDRRDVHPTRPVVVLSRPDTNVDPNWPVVLVCPLSSSTGLKTRFCVKLAAGEANSNKKTWIRVPAVQPLLKSELGSHTGTLDQDKLEEVQARLLEYLGLDDDPDLPDEEPPF